MRPSDDDRSAADRRPWGHQSDPLQESWPIDPIARRDAISRELRRVRLEADAARLSARADRLESMLIEAERLIGDRFGSWNEVVAAQSSSLTMPTRANAPSPHLIDPHSNDPRSNDRWPVRSIDPWPSRRPDDHRPDHQFLRFDAGHSAVGGPVTSITRSDDSPLAASAPAVPPAGPQAVLQGPGPDFPGPEVCGRVGVPHPDAELGSPAWDLGDAAHVVPEPHDVPAPHVVPEPRDVSFAELADIPAAEPIRAFLQRRESQPSGVAIGGLDDPHSNPQAAITVLASEPPRDAATRRRPLAMLLSAVVHCGLIFFLGWFTFSTAAPKDQLALTSSIAQANEETVQSISIETMELETDPTAATDIVEHDLSPVGEIATAMLASQITQGTPAPTISSASLGRSAAAAAMTIADLSSTQTTEFCGIEGGGNHFVYLVDSSGSMGDAFASARLELLRSIQSLLPDQRFYVIFFDEQTDYMRLSDPRVDEPASVMATAENKELLRRWAMRIQMNAGRAPYDALRFALKLQPDVIFMLSDGEFPASIEKLLLEENRRSNLFGDEMPISIIHTIGYHSNEGEQRMRQIAQQHRGQYRYVPAAR